MTTRQRFSKEGRKRIFLDKNDLTNIYRHNRSPKTLFLAFLFIFFIFEGTFIVFMMFFEEEVAMAYS